MNAPSRIELIGVPDFPLVKPGDDLATLIAAALERAGLRPVAGDILVVAQKIVSQFPTAIAMFTGVFGDCNAATSTIGPSDISRNAAISAGAANLAMIGGKVPFIDTYESGLGGLKIINGHGTVANPQPGTNSYLKSITAPGHPTGPGSKFLSDWLTGEVKELITH